MLGRETVDWLLPDATGEEGTRGAAFDRLLPIGWTVDCVIVGSLLSSFANLFSQEELLALNASAIALSFKHLSPRSLF